jgi:hypothetical protein
MSDLPDDDGGLPLPTTPDPALPTEDEDLETGVLPEDEPEPEPEPGEPPQAAEPQRQRTRRGEEARWRERYERELADLRQQVAQPRPQQPYVDPQAQLRAYQDRWNQMALEGRSGEAMAEMLQLGQQQIQQQTQRVQWDTRDAIDKQAYDSSVRQSALHRSYQPEVERLVASERARGNYAVSREDVLHQLVGRDAVARAARAAPGQVAAGRRRVAAQTTTPGTPRGDVARGSVSRSQAQSDEDLLRGITTDDL